MKDLKKQEPMIQGAGGGGKKGGGAASNDKDTLRSFAHASIIDAISEGPIQGLVNGESSIYLNKTPLPNIREVTWQYRAGLPDDDPITGVGGASSFVNVGADVSQVLGPITRTITDTNLDAVKLYIAQSALYSVDMSKGGMKVTDGGWIIELRSAGGQWTTVVTKNLDREKISSQVQFEHHITLTGTGPWDIRVSAKHPKRDNIENNISWLGYAAITKGQFSYPHTALIALDMSSEHVGNSQPSRHYHIKGRKILVPNNYNPETREYTGVWNGTFKRVWSNNPAWIFYDMVENNVFGIGSEVNVSIVNKWRLYTIGQYCDQLVPSGYKNAQGVEIMEPRYTYNGTITDKKEAFDALRSMTTVWRGMGFYAHNQFFTTADMPQDPAHIYSPANVVDGRFEYTTSSLKARHSVVLVKFNDPDNMFEPAIEPYVDNKLLRQIGWREKSLQLNGCSSRSLARRYGQWICETEREETETVNFTVGLDSIHALPGEVIAINDPRRAAARASGRVVSVNVSNRRIVLDQPLPSIGSSLSLRIQLNDGTLEQFTGSISADGLTFTVATTNDLGKLAMVQGDAVYMATATQLAPRLYRIVTIDEQSNNTFKITALQYDENKFARVENGIVFEPKPYKLDNTKILPPTNLMVEQRSYTDGGQIRTDFELKWTAPSEALMTSHYVVTVDTPTAVGVNVGNTNRNSTTYSTTEAGTYTFQVRSVAVTGSKSVEATVSAVAIGASSIQVGRVTDLVNAATLQGGSNVAFSGTDVRVSWRNMMKVSSVGGVAEAESDDAIYSHTNLAFFFGTTKVRTQRVKGNSFIYTLDMNRADAAAIGLSSPQRRFRIEATIVDKSGRVSLPTSIELVNAAPAVVIPTVTVEESTLSINWAPSTNKDVAGYMLHIHKDDASAASREPTVIVTNNNYKFKGDSLQTYYIAVVGYDVFGTTGLNYGAYITARTSLDGSDVEPPPVPVGLTMTGALNAKTGLVDVTALWTQASGGDTDTYQLEVNAGGPPQILTLRENSAKFSVEQATAVTVRLRASDRAYNWSDWSSAVSYTAPADRVAPAMPAGFKASGAFNAFTLEWARNVEPDMSHYQVWEGAASATLTAATVHSYEVSSNMLMLTGYADGVTRFFAVRAVDRGGNASAWTALKSAQTTSLTIAPPSNPTAAPTITQVMVRNGAEVQVTALGATSTEARNYELKVTLTGDVERIFRSDTATMQFTTLPGVSGSLRYRYIGEVGASSGWSPVTTFTTLKDNTAPAAPAALRVTPGLTGSFGLDWDAVTAADLSHYEVHWSESGSVPAASVKGVRSVSEKLMLSGMTERVLYWFWVRAVDFSGNASAWRKSAAQFQTTSVEAEIARQVANSTWTDSIGFILPYTGSALPTTNIGKTISWNGKLYVWNGTAYGSSSSVSIQDFGTGFITTDMLATSAIQLFNERVAAAQAQADLAVTNASNALSSATEAARQKTLAEAEKTAAKSYRDEVALVKENIDGSISVITQTEGIVATAKVAAVLASGNERFQHGLDGWQLTGGSLSDLEAYKVNGVAAVAIYDFGKNLQFGPAINLTRAATAAVQIDGANFTVAANRPRIYRTNGLRFLRTTTAETIGIAQALGTVDVITQMATGSPRVQKALSVGAGWWSGVGDTVSVVIYPSGTLT